MTYWQIFCNLFYILYIMFILEFLGIRNLLFRQKSTLISQCVNELIKRNIQFIYESKGLSNNLFCVIHNEEFYDNPISFHFYFKDENQVEINCIDHSSNEVMKKQVADFKELLKYKPFAN